MGKDVRYMGLDGLCKNKGDNWLGYYPLEQNGKYIKGGSFVYICDFNKDDLEFTLGGRVNKSKIFKGIDTFANVLKHELLHRDHWVNWWNDYGGWPTDGKVPHDILGEEVVDGDLDRIPDDHEWNQGLGYTVGNTYTHSDPSPKDMFDEHHLTYWTAEKWELESAKNEDWANPGQNWGFSW